MRSSIHLSGPCIVLVLPLTLEMEHWVGGAAYAHFSPRMRQGGQDIDPRRQDPACPVTRRGLRRLQRRLGTWDIGGAGGGGSRPDLSPAQGRVVPAATVALVQPRRRRRAAAV